jgi:hypothetical protein
MGERFVQVDPGVQLNMAGRTDHRESADNTDSEHQMAGHTDNESFEPLNV